MWSEIFINLQNAGIGMFLFVLAYVSNMCFSIYYNIKILNQDFAKQRLIDSGLKILAFDLGTVLLITSITTLPMFAEKVGYNIPSEYEELLSSITILSVFIIATCKYAFESFTKLKLILFSDNKVMDKSATEIEPG